MLQNLVDAADVSTGPNLVFLMKNVVFTFPIFVFPLRNGDRLFIDLHWFSSVFAVLKLAMSHYLTISFDLRRAQLA